MTINDKRAIALLSVTSRSNLMLFYWSRTSLLNYQRQTAFSQLPHRWLLDDDCRTSICSWLNNGIFFGKLFKIPQDSLWQYFAHLVTKKKSLSTHQKSKRCLVTSKSVGNPVCNVSLWDCVQSAVIIDIHTAKLIRIFFTQNLIFHETEPIINCRKLLFSLKLAF